MTRVVVDCCGMCSAPMTCTDSRKNERSVVSRKEGLKVEIVTSRGGWGAARTDIVFSEEVCGGCFDAFRVAVKPLHELFAAKAKVKSKSKSLL